MSKKQKLTLFVLRLALGWLFLYAGLTKVLDSNWSAAGYLTQAASLHGFYEWLATPQILPFVNFVNEWGLVLLGLSLIFGLFVRVSSLLGVVLMLLYYIPILSFPKVGEHSFIVDEHIIYILVLKYFWAIDAGKFLGLDALFKKRV